MKRLLRPRCSGLTETPISHGSYLPKRVLRPMGLGMQAACRSHSVCQRNVHAKACVRMRRGDPGRFKNGSGAVCATATAGGHAAVHLKFVKAGTPVTGVAFDVPV